MPAALALLAAKGTLEGSAAGEARREGNLAFCAAGEQRGGRQVLMSCSMQRQHLAMKSFVAG